MRPSHLNVRSLLKCKLGDEDFGSHFSGLAGDSSDDSDEDPPILEPEEEDFNPARG